MVSVKGLLQKKLSQSEIDQVRKSFDLIGTVAIIEIPKPLRKKKKLIAKAIMQSNNRIEAVLLKTGAHSGKYRIEPLQWVLGKRQFVADYKESGCHFHVPLGKTYFSPRLSTERDRIASLVKPGEWVGVFFGGVGPFSIIIAKKSKPDRVVSFEWNPTAVRYLEENIVLNKVVGKVESVKGDVGKTSPLFYGLLDRVVMPSPETARQYLRNAIQCLKPEGGTIHYYCFSGAQNPSEEPKAFVESIAQSLGKKANVLHWKIVRPYSKETVQVCLDVEVKS